MGLRQPYRAAVIAGSAGVVVVASVLLSGGFSYRDVALRAALEMTVGLVAGLAGLLVLGRFSERGRLGELVLGSALLSLGVTNVIAGVIPALVSEPAPWTMWARLPTLLLATAALASSPFLLGWIVVRRRAALAVGLAVVATVQTASGLFVHLLADRLPAQQSGSLDWIDSVQPAILGGHGALALLYAAAALGFARAGRNEDDPIVRLLGLGSALAAVAHLYYALSPSLYSESVSIGDAFRLAFYLCILLGAVREVAAYQRSVTANGVLEERRRLARELHDGLAQELAFLVVQARLLRDRHGELAGVDVLEKASQRALDESRLAIGALTRPGYEPLELALATAAEEIAHRTGVDVRFELPHGVDVEPGLRDAVVRIAREAMTNAVRHGHANEVRLELADEDGLHLRVIDDGCGFEVEGAHRPGRGFGLVSMRERAEALGGRFDIASRPGVGTRVEVTLP